MKDFFENVDLDEISDDDFEKKINSLNQEDLNDALQQSVRLLVVQRISSPKHASPP